MQVLLASDTFMVRRDSENCHLNLTTLCDCGSPDHTHLLFLMSLLLAV